MATDFMRCLARRHSPQSLTIQPIMPTNQPVLRNPRPWWVRSGEVISLEQVIEKYLKLPQVRQQQTS